MLRSKGFSFAEIAKALGEFTRDAVLGKAKRMGLSQSTLWEPEKDELLKKLLAEGLSSAQIGERMGITKNAVIGRVNRLKLRLARKPCEPLKPRLKPKRKVMRPAEPRTPVSVTGPVEPSALPALPPFTSYDKCLTLDQLRSPALIITQCRWPVDGPEGTRYCGSKAHEPLPYCGHHARIAYTPIRHSGKRLALTPMNAVNKRGVRAA